MDKFLEALQSTIGTSLPGVFGALIILVVGWIFAFIVKALVRKGLNLCELNNRVNKNTKEKVDLEGGIGLGGYYLTLLITLLAVFNQLGLEVVSEPIQGLVAEGLDFIPKVLGAAILITIALIIARIIKQLVISVLVQCGVESKGTADKKSLSESMGDVSYWLVVLIFLPGILEIFELQGLLAPAQSMVDQILGMLPNILGAALIIFVGWFIAKILREVVTNLLEVANVDKLSENIGLKADLKLSNVAGVIVYFLVFVPALIEALSVLDIEAIANPAKDMLRTIVGAIPDIIGAFAIILITYLIAKPITKFVSKVLSAGGFDELPKKVGFKEIGKPVLSEVVGKIIFFFMILFASVEAANRLKFEQFSEFVSMFIQFGGQVLLGSAIIVVGLWLANFISVAMNKTAQGGDNPLSGIVKIVILALVFAMGLRAMGLANDIVNMAFGLTLGAAAVAFAVSFGIGGREAAGKHMDHWLTKLRKDSK